MNYKNAIQKAGLYLLMVLVAGFFLLPLIWMVSGSLKVESELYASLGKFRSFLPIPFTLENYREMFTRTPFFRFLLNSIIITGSTVLTGLLVNSLAGYALSRLDFPGRKLVDNSVLALIIVPFETIFVPLFLIVERIGGLNTYWAMIVPFVADPFSIFLFRQFFIQLPEEIEEAAYIDGAGYFRTYFQVMAPLSKPVFATVAIWMGLNQWNRFLWPMVVTSDKLRQPLSVGLRDFFTNPPVHWSQILAFSSLMSIPILLLFLAFQRHFYKGIAAQAGTD